MSKTKSSIENRQSKIRYSFPTVSKCPRCGGTQTRATSTQGKVQYRKCLAPVCRWRYTVIGTKVNKTLPIAECQLPIEKQKIKNELTTNEHE